MSALQFHRKPSVTRASALPALALAVASMLAGPVRGQSQPQLPLQIEVDNASQVSRTCGPIRLQLNLDWGGPGVFHGTLVLEARDSERALLGTFVVDNLYLTEGQQSQELMLPGFRAGSAMIDDALTLTPTLIESQSEKRTQLRDLQVLIPAEELRELVVAILAPDALVLERRENDVVNSLKLENMAPQQLDKVRILTKSVDWRAEDAPQEPLRYCACDILLLPSSGLKLLQQPQLDALLAWLRAGGAACVLAEGDGHDQPQVRWLNTLAGADDEHPVFFGDSSGRLVHELDESSDTCLRRLVGLGRAAVIVGPDQAHPRAPHWRNTAAFLWRVKHVHLPEIAQGRSWDLAYTLRAAELSLNQRTYGNAYGNIQEAQLSQAGNFQPLPPFSLTDLVLRLLPDGVRLVPLSAMGLMLFGYLIAIGPLDYFVLGRLKMRRWTWVTFPLITLLFTGVSIGVSNRFMSANVMRRTSLLRDIAPDGEVVRENRLELLFPSTSQALTTNVGRGLCMPTRYQDFAQFQNLYYDPYSNQYSTVGRAQPAVYHGRMPAQCSLVQTVPQWTPQLNRSLTIPLAQPDDAPDFDWSDVPDFESAEGLAQLRDRIRKSFDVELTDQLRSGFSDTVTAGLYHLESSQVLLGDPSLIEMHAHEQRLVNTQFGQQWMTQTETYVKQLSVATQAGFQAVVSQYAPTGGDRFEDVLMLDPTDPDQWLLVIVQPRGTDIHIYRRLYVIEH